VKQKQLNTTNNTMKFVAILLSYLVIILTIHLTKADASNQFGISHINFPSLLRLRGGSDQSRGFLSFGANPSHSQNKQPTSFQQSQSQSYNENVQVTDVTNEIKDQEREETKEVIDAFLTRDSRNSFIVRVYAILTAQLLLVALSILAFGRYPALGIWMMTKGKVVPWASIAISSGTMIFMSISERARRVAPLKWQLLGLFSVSEAIVVGMISSFYKSKTVMSAALSTAVATMSVTMYTVFNRDSKRDLSQWGAGLSS
jgi:FtsH-binding integral membrane protein